MVRKRKLFTFIGGLMGDAGTTFTILLFVFILTVVLGVVLVLFAFLGKPFALLGFLASLIMIPVMIISSILFNFGSVHILRTSDSFWMIPFSRADTPSYGYHQSYRKLFIAQKLTTFGIAIFIYLFSLIVSTILFLIPPSINPICLIALPVSFPFMLITITMPAIAWMSFGYAFDPYEPEPRGYLVIALLWGMLSTFPSLFLNTFNSIWMEPLGLDASILSAPIFEEIFKSMGFFIIFSQIKDETDGILYGILFGAGFALVENFLYGVNAILAAGGIGFFLLIGFRSFFNMALHIVGPALIGFSIGVFRAFTLKGKNDRGKGCIQIWDVFLPFIAIPFLFVGILNHMIWNLLAGSSLFFLPLLMLLGLFEFFMLLGLVLLGFTIATGRFKRSGAG